VTAFAVSTFEILENGFFVKRVGEGVGCEGVGEGVGDYVLCEQNSYVKYRSSVFTNYVL
jgi:hypothetical protein